MGAKELEVEDRDDTIAKSDSEGDVQAETTLTTMTTEGDMCTSEAGSVETTNDPHTDGDTISNTMPTGGDTSEKSAIDDESGSEDENESRKIERCFRGIQQIEIERLVEPSEMYRVRPINEERVKMTKLFIEKKQTSLTSYLTVLEQHGDDGTKYVVVDGNHRLRAVQYIRDYEGRWSVSKLSPVVCTASFACSGAELESHQEQGSFGCL